MRTELRSKEANWLVRFQACLLAAGLIIVMGGLSAPVNADPEEEAGEGEATAVVDALTYSELTELRVKLSLLDDDLAMLDCSKADAEKVLGALRTWYVSNKTALEAVPIARCRRELRYAIYNKTRDDVSAATISGLKAAYASAVAEKKRLVETAISPVEDQLSAGQASSWRLIRSNASVPRDYRMVPNLTAEQLRALRKARVAYERNCASAKTESQALAARRAFKTKIAATLTSAQMDTMAQANTVLRRRIAGVVAASEEVLPLPDELKTHTQPVDVD